MEVESKIKQDMKGLGCQSEMKIALAYHLYIYLVDKKKMYDTEYCYNKDIDKVYIVARPSKTSKPNIYVPIAAQDTISMDYINEIQEHLCTVETGPTVNLAFIDGDFTTVIYTFTKEFVNKEPIGVSEIQRAKYYRSFIDKELQKCRTEILNTAFHGGVVDNDGCEPMQ